MITKPIRKTLTSVNGRTIDIIKDEVAESLHETGIYLPEIQKVTFNYATKTVKNADGTEAPRNVLATIIEWCDGTKTTVTNSANDVVDMTSGEPTHQAKELGVVYAIVKRLIGKYEYDEDQNLTFKTPGFGRILNTIVKNAYDMPAEAKKEEAERAARKAKHAEDMKRAAEKRAARKAAADNPDIIKQLAALVAAELQKNK